MSLNEKPEFLNINNILYQTRISKKFRNRKKYVPADPKRILSFIPGKVVDIYVTTGQSVQKGELLMILEAMKMQNRLRCIMDGKVKSIQVAVGDKVSKGTLLIELE
jgi:biotin carboxyl carrier protein